MIRNQSKSYQRFNKVLSALERSPQVCTGVNGGQLQNSQHQLSCGFGDVSCQGPAHWTSAGRLNWAQGLEAQPLSNWPSTAREDQGEGSVGVRALTLGDRIKHKCIEKMNSPVITRGERQQATWARPPLSVWTFSIVFISLFPALW